MPTDSSTSPAPAPAPSRSDLLRHQAVLLHLGADTSTEFGTFLKRVLKADAGILGVERVSFWTFESDPPAIRCVTLFSATNAAFSGGVHFEEASCPRYFQALRKELIISAEEARHDLRTSEFADSYLAPLGISSMLDVPVWCRGELRGVLCHEHVGGPRAWTPEDQNFALSMSQFVSMGLERDEARHIERALQESEERYELLARSAKDFSLWLLDPTGRIRGTAERIRGFKPEEVAGEHLSKFFPKNGTQVTVGEALRIAADRGHYEREGWLTRKDGSRYWGRMTLSPLRHESGALRGFASITRDLTEQQLAREKEQLLEDTRRAERRERLLSDLSAIVNASLNAQRVLIPAAHLITRSFCSGCGLRADDPTHRNEAIRVVAARDPAVRATLEAAIAAMSAPSNWGPAVLEVTTGRKALLYPRLGAEDVERLASNEEARTQLRALGPVSVMIVPIAVRRRALGSVGFYRRADEPPFDEQDLELAREVGRRLGFAVDNARLYALAREAVRVRDQFLSVAAHEFRTPLTTLNLHLHLVDRVAGASLTGEAADSEHRHMELALRQLARLGGLIEELLQSSHVSAGSLELHRDTMDLSALVREEAEIFETEAARVGSTLTVSVDDHVLGRWDRGRIEQVVTNLLTNALRYGRGKPIALTLRASPDDVYLIVKDQGIGIAMEDQQRIFGRFERAADPRHFGGLGLGLFITRRIVEAHRGTIEVSSEPGRGSTFVVRLPRWSAANVHEHVSFAGREARAEETT